EWAGDVRYASDYFDALYEFAEELITRDKAYVCALTADEMAEYRGSLKEPGRNSPYRDRPVEESLQLFRDMRDGKYQNGELVLRAKIDMSSPNINMRDP
ncbi:MAG TPA: glutamine--tRNA ligase, partial [Marinobacter adhaerens]|nr:glutamine--tRNA ligase [Marinobacter adhaerens]